MANEVRARAWCFTVNNPDFGAEVYEAIVCRYIVVGDEHGEVNGTPHHQGFVYFDTQRTFGGVKDILPNGAHIEKARGSCEQNKAYCTKEKLLCEFGEAPHQGKRSDITDVREMLAEGMTMSEVCDFARSYQSIKCAESILKYQEPRRLWAPKVFWFWGPTGTGKTRTAFDLCETEPWVSAGTLRWWDGYDGHHDVILDDLRGDCAPFHVLLRVLDRYPYRVEVKGGSRQLLARRIFITCPYPPTQLYRTIEDVGQLLRRIHEIRHFETVVPDVSEVEG